MAGFGLTAGESPIVTVMLYDAKLAPDAARDKAHLDRAIDAFKMAGA